MSKSKIIPHRTFLIAFAFIIKFLHLVPCSSTVKLQLRSDAENVFATRESTSPVINGSQGFLFFYRATSSLAHICARLCCIYRNIHLTSAGALTQKETQGRLNEKDRVVQCKYQPKHHNRIIPCRRAIGVNSPFSSMFIFALLIIN